LGRNAVNKQKHITEAHKSYVHSCSLVWFMMTDTLKKKHEYACSVGLNMGTVNEQRANAQV
jgi:hypothetical protein